MMRTTINKVAGSTNSNGWSRTGHCESWLVLGKCRGPKRYRPSRRCRNCISNTADPDYEIFIPPEIFVERPDSPCCGQCGADVCNGVNGGIKSGGYVCPPYLAQAMWLSAVILHMIFLVLFVYHRAIEFKLHHMVPSWFVPPIGIIVADVAFPGGALRPLAEGLLVFGMGVYAVMLPIMVYRLIFSHEIPDAAKPTIAIMAAPCEPFPCRVSHRRAEPLSGDYCSAGWDCGTDDFCYLRGILSATASRF